MFKIEKIKNVHIFTDLDPDGFYNNVTVIKENSGLTIIDTFKKSSTMKAFIEVIENYNKPILRVIFTHWHIDHTLGAYFLQDFDIYSSLECKNKLIEFLEKYQDKMITKGVVEEGLTVVIPNKIITGKTQTIRMDNGQKLVIEVISGHSHDGVIIHYKNILIVGDNLVGKEVEILLPPAIPPDAPQSNVEDLFNCLDYLDSVKPEYVIYGHGKRLLPGDIIEDNRTRLNKSLSEIKY